MGTPHVPFKVIWSDVQTRVGTPHKVLRCFRSQGGNRTFHLRLSGKILKQENTYGRLMGGLFQEIFPLQDSILQAGACQIVSLAENPRWSRVWQKSNRIRV